MNRLSSSDRARVLHLFCEGSSIRAVVRVTGFSKNTVIKLLCDAGKACMAYHDEHVRGLTTTKVQVDEIWSFTYAKQKNVAGAKAAPEGSGDTWTWTAIDADTKLIAAYFVGGRDAWYAEAFMRDLATRLLNRVQLTSDSHKAYLQAVEGAFDSYIDYAQLVKMYGAAPESAAGRYSPAECTGIKKAPVMGAPDPEHVYTSFVERHNLTMRMHMRRFTRLTNGFSKSVENHAYAVALQMMYYNFVRIHQKLRMTPAMAAGVSSKLWEIDDFVALAESSDAPPRKRSPYRKRVIVQ